MSSQVVPLVTTLQLNAPALALHPAGKVVRLLVSCNAVARRASSVVKVMLMDWPGEPNMAVIWPEGAAVPTTLSLVVAAYGIFTTPKLGVPLARFYQKRKLIV